MKDMKNKGLITAIAIFGLIFSVLGLILCFFPLGTIDIVPAAIGLIIGIIAYFLIKKTGYRKKLVFSVLIISVLAILISLFSEVFIENKVAEDTQFEEQIEQSSEESIDDLEEALEDLEEPADDSIN